MSCFVNPIRQSLIGGIIQGCITVYLSRYFQFSRTGVCCRFKRLGYFSMSFLVCQQLFLSFFKLFFEAFFRFRCACQQQRWLSYHGHLQKSTLIFALIPIQSNTINTIPTHYHSHQVVAPTYPTAFAPQLFANSAHFLISQPSDSP